MLQVHPEEAGHDLVCRSGVNTVWSSNEAVNFGSRNWLEQGKEIPAMHLPRKTVQFLWALVRMEVGSKQQGSTTRRGTICNSCLE